MKILFIHPNMPGQYKHLVRAFADDPEHEVAFVTKETPVTIPNVHKVEYRVERDSKPDIHRYLINFERAIFTGQEVWRVCKKLKHAGFIPDVICAHPGWGDVLFIKDIFPHSPLLNFVEFYYSAFGSDMHFDKTEPVVPDELGRVRIKNANNLINLDACDWAISPMHWQAGQNPAGFQSKISVLHDGVDTDAASPSPGQTYTLPNGVTLTQDDEVVTHVERNFEPYRGFFTVMRAIEVLLKERPKAHFILVGADGVSYGKAPEGDLTYRQMMLKELDIDRDRVHFVGTVPHSELMTILQVSSAHLYFTVPFVLSWSMLESMATECLLIASDTPPVKEVIEHGKNGLLVDFFSHDELIKQVHHALDHRDDMVAIRKAARQTVLDKYSLEKLLPYHKSLVLDLAKGELPPSTHDKIMALYDTETHAA